MLFGPQITYDLLERRLAEGAKVKATTLTNTFSYSDSDGDQSALQS
jgi:hypothetical protein